MTKELAVVIRTSTEAAWLQSLRRVLPSTVVVVALFVLGLATPAGASATEDAQGVIAPPGTEVPLGGDTPEGEPRPQQTVEIHPYCTGETSPPFEYGGDQIGANGKTSCEDESGNGYTVDEVYASSDLQVYRGPGIWDTVDFDEQQVVSTTGVIAVTSTIDVECSGTRNYRNDTFHWVFEDDRRYEGAGAEEAVELYCYP